MRVEPRPSILTVEPYVGGESKLPGVNRVMKLSSNEGPFGPPPGAIEALRAAAADAHRYPDGSARALREAIGARFALDPARIVCGNGSDEILTLLLLAYSGEGTKIVMTTHDLGQARRLAGDVAFLHRGRLVEHTPAEAFFNPPATPQAAAFLRGELLWSANQPGDPP